MFPLLDIQDQSLYKSDCTLTLVDTFQKCIKLEYPVVQCRNSIFMQIYIPNDKRYIIIWFDYTIVSIYIHVYVKVQPNWLCEIGIAIQ